MNLMEESFQNKEEKKKKRTTTIILVAIAIVLLIIISIIVYLVQVQKSQLKIYVDNEQNSKIKDILSIEDDGKIYFQIKSIAEYLGYDSFNGHYDDKSEQTNKCYVETKDKEEVANFELGSKKIWKLDITGNDNNYEYYETNYPVKAINGVLYAEKSMIEKAFNASIEYDNNKITILTMSYLINAYSSKVLDYGYKEISDVFANKKTVLEDMLVVKKDEKIMGVINVTNGKTILDAKYDDILYLPNVGDFIVKTDEKYGVISKDASTKIRIMYDSIKLMDKDAELYLVEKDNKFGALDLRGKTKIDIDNDEIGIDISKFERNEIKNKYILADNLIPVRQDKYWGLFDKKGNQVVDFIYDSFGYVAPSNKNAISLLVIPNYNVIVACKDKKYTLLNYLGTELFPPVADDIYMAIEGNEKKYYIIANDRKIDAEERLKSLDIVAQREDNNSKENSNPRGNQQSNENNNENNFNNEEQQENNQENADNQENENNQNEEENSEENDE